MDIELSLVKLFVNDTVEIYKTNGDLISAVYLAAKNIFNACTMFALRKTALNKCDLLYFAQAQTGIFNVSEKELKAFYCESGKRSYFVDSENFSCKKELTKVLDSTCAKSFVFLQLNKNVDELVMFVLGFDSEICIEADVLKELILSFSYSIKIAQLEIENEKLSHTNKVKEIELKMDTLVYHEFKIPINSIIASNEALRQNLIKDGKTKYNRHYQNFSNQIENNAYIAMRNTCNLLDCAAIREKKIKLHLRYVIIKKLIDNIAQQFITKSPELGVNIDYEVMITENMYYFFDEEKMQRIVLNLISNAIKAAKLANPENPMVKIKLHEDDKFIFVSVLDNGVGIGEQELENIFNKFYKSSVSVAYSTSGTGLGLCMSKELALIMNGDISVTSNINTGSEFVLRVPKLLHCEEQQNQELNSYYSLYDEQFNEYIKMEMASLA